MSTKFVISQSTKDQNPTNHQQTTYGSKPNSAPPPVVKGVSDAAKKQPVATEQPAKSEQPTQNAWKAIYCGENYSVPTDYGNKEEYHYTSYKEASATLISTHDIAYSHLFAHVSTGLIYGHV